MEVKKKSQSIVKIDPAQYGLTETKAKEIEAMFKPMLDKMVELEEEFNQIAGLEINKETCQQARDLRLKYVKVRTGTANIHKELKAFYLNGGRFVDGWKNAQLFASQGMEQRLFDIEQHYENLERERIAKLQEKRASEMEKLDPSYVDQYIPENLGQMPEDIWNNFILGIKTNYEARKEAEHKTEQERIAREKAETEERERIKQENIRLQKEAEERERQEKIEAEKREKEEKAREEKEKKDRAAYEASLEKERKERKRAEAELQAKKEAEEQARIEAEAKAKAEEQAIKKAERDARLAPDKKKLEKLASDISDIQFPDVKSQEAKDLIEAVGNKLEQVSTYILQFAKDF